MPQGIPRPLLASEVTSATFFEAQLKHHILHLSFVPALGLAYFMWEVDSVSELGRWCGGPWAA